MSGRACVLIDSDAEAARARRGAERAGVLIEVERHSLGEFPFDPQSFDLVVFDNRQGLISSMTPEMRALTIHQARRVLAPRGRTVVIETAPRAGLGALLNRAAVAAEHHYTTSGGTAPALQAEGFKAVRELARRDGLSFFEGIV